MNQAGFNLRSWISSLVDLNRIAQEDGLLDTSQYPKVLGLHWDPHNDVIGYPHYQKSTNEEVTKRDLMKTIGKLYDPLGLLSPVTVRAKIIMQQVWKASLPWDEPLPPALLQQFRILEDDLQTVTRLQVPTYYFAQTIQDRIQYSTYFATAQCKVMEPQRTLFAVSCRH